MDEPGFGFTLIEMLVVLAIIGILSTLAFVAVNAARARSRDSKRAADIKQIQTALEIGYTELQAYPFGTNCGNGTLPCSAMLGDNTVVGGSATATILCKDTNTPPNPIWTNDATKCAAPYMGKVPANPIPNGSSYLYNSTDNAHYSIVFTLEGGTSQLSAGVNCANSSGITAGAGC